MVPHTIPQWDFNFPRSTDEIQFFDEISSSGKICQFDVDLKYVYQSIFPFWGGSNLVLGIGRKNQIFFLRTPAAVKFFHQTVRKMILLCKKKSLPTRMDLYDPYMVSYRVPLGYYNFPRGTNKIQFFDEISTSGNKLLI